MSAFISCAGLHSDIVFLRRAAPTAVRHCLSRPLRCLFSRAGLSRATAPSCPRAHSRRYWPCRRCSGCARHARAHAHAAAVLFKLHITFVSAPRRPPAGTQGRGRRATPAAATTRGPGQRQRFFRICHPGTWRRARLDIITEMRNSMLESLCLRDGAAAVAVSAIRIATIVIVTAVVTTRFVYIRQIQRAKFALRSVTNI